MTNDTLTYGFGTHVDVPVERAIDRVTTLLKEQGFGVLTTIDVRSTLREKIGVEFRDYRILGVCNPQFAHQGLTLEPELGLLLPCNVVVHEEPGGARVMFMDPIPALEMTGNSALTPLATEVRRRLRAVSDQLASA